MNAVGGTGIKSRRAINDGKRNHQGKQMSRTMGTRLREKDAQRHYDTHPPLKTILIVTEDTKGGLFYLEDIKSHLRLNAEVVAVSSPNSDPLNIVKHTIKKAKNGRYSRYDGVFCLFDGDVWHRGNEEQERVNRAIDLAKQTFFSTKEERKKRIPLHALVSTPCFEVFLLLHFQATLPGPYSFKQVPGRQSLCLGVEQDLSKAMQNNGVKYYNKNNHYDFKKVFAPRIRDAWRRSRRDALMRRQTRATPPNPPAPLENPSTEAHRLLAVLLRMSDIKERSLRSNRT